MDTQNIVVMIFGVKLGISPTYRKWPQLLIDTKNCIYQRLENVVISAMKRNYQWLYIIVIPDYRITKR